jgi:hypothetical protein
VVVVMRWFSRGALLRGVIVHLGDMIVHRHGVLLDAGDFDLGRRSRSHAGDDAGGDVCDRREAENGTPATESPAS